MAQINQHKHGYKYSLTGVGISLNHTKQISTTTSILSPIHIKMRSIKVLSSIMVIATIFSLSLPATAMMLNRQQKRANGNGNAAGAVGAGKGNGVSNANANGNGNHNFGSGTHSNNGGVAGGNNLNNDNNNNDGNWGRGGYDRGVGGVGVGGVVPVRGVLPVATAAALPTVVGTTGLGLGYGYGLGAYAATCNQINAVSCSQYALGAVCPAITYTYSCVCYTDGTCSTLSGLNSCYECQQDSSVVSVLDGTACQAC